MRRANHIQKLSLSAATLLMFAAVSVSAATFTVTNDADSGPGSLRQALLDANASGESDEIEFDGTFFGTPRIIVLTSGDLAVETSGDLTITGPGAHLLSLSGNDLVRVMSIAGTGAGGTVSISGLTIRDGDSIGSPAGGGGGIAVNPGEGSNPSVVLNLSSVVITENEGRGEGGGIWIYANGSLNIDSSLFSYNTAGSGAGIDCGSGGGFCTSVNITNTTFHGNSASTGGGGMMCCGNATPMGTPINIENTTFSSNTSVRNGSAFRSANFGAFSFKNSTFVGNHATSEGPAVQLQRAIYTFENVTIAYNTTVSPGDTAGVTGAPGNSDELFVHFRNSIVAKNSNALGEDDIDVAIGTFISEGYNIFGTIDGATVVTGDTTGNQIGVDPRLDPILRNHGGPTKTLALRQSSPAIDAGDPGTFEATDQRGVARPADGDGNGSAIPDIGAFERLSTDIIPANRFDFDGDGATDVSVFRPDSLPASQWWLLRSSDLGTRGLQFGSSTDIPVAADFTGDGKTDVAFWRPASGEWFILRSEDDSFFAFPFGANGDIPAPGDFDGDGKTDPAVYRPSAGTWFVFRSSDSQVSVVPFGVAADQPIVADYDGDGMDDVGVYRAPDNQFWLLRSTDGVKAFQFGQAGDRTTVGDWTGDGKADVAFFRPSTSEWYVIRSEDDSFFAFPWGATGDVPSPGDFDGDGVTDPAVWRPSDNTWYIFGTTNGFEAVQFGSPGDVPLPSSVSVN